MAQTPTAAPIAPTLPPAPQGTPAWLIRLVSVCLLVSGPVLSVWDPGGKINTTAAQAVIIIVFLVAALILFTIHVVLGAVHEYGWSKKAAIDVASTEIAELRNEWPSIKQQWDAAQPALSQLPAVKDLVAQVSTLGTTVEAKVHETLAQLPAPVLASLTASVKTQLAADAAGITTTTTSFMPPPISAAASGS